MRRGAWTLAAWLAGASAAAQGRPWMDVELGLQASGRHLRYQDDLVGRLNTYDLAAAPGVYGRAALYPGALGGGRFGLGRRVALTGRAAWLAVLDTGAAPARYFPRQTVSAVEAAAGVAVDIGEVEVRAGVEYRRYFSSMHPEPGDAYVVGGAVDEYMAATVGFAVRR